MDEHYRILRKFEELHEIGKNGLIAFWKASEKMLHFYNEGNTPFTWTSCVEGGAYFKHEFGLPYTRWYSYSPKIKFVPQLIKIINGWKGLYHIEFNGAESHYFTIYLTDDDVYLANTYGGIRGIIIFHVNRRFWIKEFEKAMNGNLESYRLVFGLPPGVITIKEVEFHSVRYVDHKNPKFLLYDNPGIDLKSHWDYVRDPIMELSNEELKLGGLTADKIVEIRQEEKQLDGLFKTTCY